MPPKTPIWSIDWGFTPDNIGFTLGFSNPTIDTGSTLVTAYYLSDEPARLADSIEAAYLSCSIAGGSYFGNIGGSNIVTKISPTAQAGSVIFHRPQIIPQIGTNSNYVLTITSKLLRTDGTPMDLNGEFWSYVLIIRGYK
jgi:hypothetical protein